MAQLLLVLLIPVLLMWPLNGQAADECVGCHTDAARLKALVRPPPAVAEEEGAS